MKIRLLVPCFALLVCWPTAAAGVQKLARLEVALWPEYDRAAAVLVILRAWLPPDTKLPASVSLPIPRTIKPHAVATRSPDGRLVIASHERRLEGEQGLVDVAASHREVRLEYYAALSSAANGRRFRFAWPGGAEVSAFSFEVLPPAGATELSLAPKATGQRKLPNGLQVHDVALGQARSDSRPVLELTYKRSSMQPSAARLRQVHATKVPPGHPPLGAAPGRSGAPGGWGAGGGPERPSGWGTTRIAGVVAATLALCVVIWWAVTRRKSEPDRTAEDDADVAADTGGDNDDDRVS